MKVAIVGAGPAGLYALEELLRADLPGLAVDIFDRLPTPFGLIRGGVAPDHPEKKAIIDRLFNFSFSDRRVRFAGNVEIGKQIAPEDLAAHYAAVIYACGASGHSELPIQGADFQGSWRARDFVQYYNGHPDAADHEFDLRTCRAVIVGNGNVALDMARILASPIESLRRSDMSEQALSLLAVSDIEEIVILGRRGILDASFGNAELEEFAHIDGLSVAVEGEPLPDNDALDAIGASWAQRRRVAIFKNLVAGSPSVARRQLVFRFRASPIAIKGEGRVERIEVENTGAGRIQTDVIEAGLILAAVGYRAEGIAGLPFDPSVPCVANREGRVQGDANLLKGIYVTGWAKRGCRGVIGSNKSCARGTIASLLADHAAGLLGEPASGSEDFLEILGRRGIHIVDRAGWRSIDHAERSAGRAADRPRVKITRKEELLEVAAGTEGSPT